ncbi:MULTISPECIES: carbohydrate ABC transporter permease [Chelativorans]|uniref:Carbohydrate ABC transporter permease n=1 Tax=Chelativorans intermedius TaxID=515947 RepID=A0ABV6DCN0_9HYPH|nr:MULTISPECIES: sugar ABC transporter permease [Chelativorans]MCT9000653.1 sugar ABC transporter permease [Chelativorans intermedius]WEX12176.1 sugar ABC transporter permease [Chelativorans sp. AA-79]
MAPAGLDEKARRNRRWVVVSLLPVAAFFIVLTAFPVVNLLGLSFFHVEWQDGAARFDFVGMENFRRLFSQETVFWAGVRNNIVFAVVAVSGQMILGFSMALAVKTAGSYGRALLTGIFLLPIVVPPIVIGTMWRLIMGREFGLANTLLGFFGLGPVDWLGDPDLALASVIFVDIWHWTPFVFLLMLAGLESLDGEVLEAARIDTVSRWQQIRHVIMPMMLPTIAITLLFRVILSFKVFDEVYLLTSGGPGTATEVVNFSIYRTFFRQDQVGYGAAMSVVTLFSISLIIILARAFVQRRASRREAAT